jgi:hypothetical protein
MSDVDAPTSDLVLANDIIAKRVRPKTIKAYASNMKIFGKWLSSSGGRVRADGMPELPLDKALTITFFGALVQPRLQTHPIFGLPRKKVLENGGHISAATVSGYKSALVWLHVESKMTIEDSLDTELNLFVTGYRKEVAEMKQSGVMSAFEGKQALSFSGYRMLAREFLTLTPQGTSSGNHRGDGQAVTWSMGTFAWSFLLLQWNLLARYVKFV